MKIANKLALFCGYVIFVGCTNFNADPSACMVNGSENSCPSPNAYGFDFSFLTSKAKSLWQIAANVFNFILEGIIEFAYSFADFFSMNSNKNKTAPVELNIAAGVTSINPIETFANMTIDETNSIVISESPIETFANMTIDETDSIVISESPIETFANMTIDETNPVVISENLVETFANMTIDETNSIVISENLVETFANMTIDETNPIVISENLVETNSTVATNISIFKTNDTSSISENGFLSEFISNNIYEIIILTGLLSISCYLSYHYLILPRKDQINSFIKSLFEATSQKIMSISTLLSSEKSSVKKTISSDEMKLPVMSIFKS